MSVAAGYVATMSLRDGGTPYDVRRSTRTWRPTSTPASADRSLAGF